jgi:hypothetical protein
MKQLQPNGSELIYSTGHYWSRGRFDPFPSHGVLLGQGIVRGALSGYAGCIEWNLRDNSTWFYLMHISDDGDDVENFVSAWWNFYPPGYPTWSIGEGYNFVARPQTQAKLTPAEFSANWLWA